MDPTGIHRWGTGESRVEVAAVDSAATAGGRMRLVRTLLVLWMVANFLVPFAAGLWLAVKGHRLIAAAGLAMAIGFPIAWSLLAAHPAQLIAGPVTRRGAEAGPRRVTITCFIASGWQYCVLALWTLGVFAWFGARTYPGIELPMMVWAYGTVMGPFSWMAGGDHGSDSAPALALAFAFTACLVNAALHHWAVPLPTSGVLLGLLVTAGAAVNATVVGRASMRAHRSGAARQADLESLGRNLHGIMARELPRSD